MKNCIKKMIFGTIAILGLFLGFMQGTNVNAASDDTSSSSTSTSTTTTAPSDVDEQSFGDNATWSIKDNVLYLSGSSIDETETVSYDEGQVIKVPWFEQYSSLKNVTKVVITGTGTDGKLKLPANSAGLFRNLPSVTEYEGLDNLDVSDVTDFTDMFQRNTTITNLDLSSFKTDQTVDMTEMFQYDTYLESVDLSGFTGSDLTVKNIFSGTYNIDKIVLGNLNLENAGFTYSSSKVKWVNTDSSDTTGESYPNGEGTWRLKVTSDATNYGDQTFDGVNTLLVNIDPTSFGEKGENFEDVLLSDSTDYQKVVLDGDAYCWELTIPEEDLPKYVGDTIKIEAPEVSGYTPDVSYIELTAKYNNQTSTGSFYNTTNINESGTQYYLSLTPTYDHIVNAKVSTSSLSANIPFSYVFYYTKDSDDSSTTGDEDDDDNSTTTGDEDDDDGNSTTTGDEDDNGNSSSNSDSNYVDKEQTVSTYPDRKAVKVYDKNGNLNETVELAPNTDWYSDQEATINNEKYYRVATNKWIKASDAYVYKSVDKVVKTKDVEYESLKNSHGKAVTNRALAGLSKWKVDKLTELDGEDYYRVATNEFVKAANVNIVK
ncbi:SLAP domain-containing protein [Companilactobacillus halodurans]|uniref:BspA family leucine-rich repeat surface protein n=1 Tax=Companilactobacillus halodurans TaxID=2584183 RepID=A0A5P0ZZ41_9LACO|nr:SLAP domain-containing protein [Companilactobacillus halodurans]MQS98363.1 BspA family leucine-rich repeat surface protein [Companilactobacillus halodurans]